MHKECADGNLAGGSRGAGFFEGILHKFDIVVHPERENSTLAQEYFYTEAAEKAHIPHRGKKIGARSKSSRIEEKRGIVEIEKQEVTLQYWVNLR